MNFLWFGEEWLSSVSQQVGGTVIKAARTLFFSVVSFIYGLIIDLYNLFHALCSSRLLDNDLLEALSERIGLILGIVMLFYVIFSFIQMLVNPESFSDKEKGAVSIIKKTLLVIVMLGVSNFVFDTLYYVQRTVVESNVISKLLLPYSIETNINGELTQNTGAVMDNKKFGAVLSEELLHSFYYLEDFDSAEADESSLTVINGCKNVVNAFRNQIINSGRFDLGYNCLNEEVVVKINSGSGLGSYEQETHVINFNWLLSILCGVIVVYLLFMYCIKIGVRMVQLMFLEIISPMAIVSYLSPKKDTMFTKWKNIYFSTYIDVFIRMAIINFIFFLVATLFSTTGGEGIEFWNTISAKTASARSFIIVVMVLALLTFAKKAPDLLKELMPAGASKLGFGASMKDIVGLQKGIGTVAGLGTGTAIGLIGGAIGGARAGYGKNGLLSGIGHGITGALGGVTGGMLRGAHAGFGAKGVSSAIQNARKNQSQVNKRNADIIANGGSVVGSNVAKVQKAMGLPTAADMDKQRVDDINNYIKYQDEIEGYAKNNSVVKRLERDYEAIKQGGRLRGESDEHYTTRMEVARQNWKRALEATVTSSMTGSDVDYHEAVLQQNATTGRWEVADSSVLSTMTHSSIPDNISVSIHSKSVEMNRVGSSLGYSSVADYTGMDTNNNQAKADVAHITSQESYKRHQANAGK